MTQILWENLEPKYVHDNFCPKFSTWSNNFQNKSKTWENWWKAVKKQYFNPPVQCPVPIYYRVNQNKQNDSMLALTRTYFLQICFVFNLQWVYYWTHTKKDKDVYSATCKFSQKNLTLLSVCSLWEKQNDWNCACCFSCSFFIYFVYIFQDCEVPWWKSGWKDCAHNRYAFNTVYWNRHYILTRNF